MVEEGSNEDDLVSRYRIEAEASIDSESERRIAESIHPAERVRLRSLSLGKILDDGISNVDLIPALLERLGPVRSALADHGGGIRVSKFEKSPEGINMVLDLTGACLSCGAAPGTLAGVRSDLEADPEINSIKFSTALLDTFDELGREFVLSHGGVEFVDTD